MNLQHAIDLHGGGPGSGRHPEGKNAHSQDKCYACGKRLGANPNEAHTRDGQMVFVGKECHKFIKQGGGKGYQPPKGGPRLFHKRQADEHGNPVE